MRSANSKAWINRQLEKNKVPAIWISNSISEMDPAYIRRFDYVLELGYPPREVRKDILRKQLNEIPVSDDWVARVSANPGIAPGVISRAAQVACAASNDAPGAVEQTLDRVLANTLAAMGLKVEDSSGTLETTTYRLDILNADQDVSAMLAALKRHPHGRLCLYGPPGTGKTAFGRHVAEQLDMPLVVKRASDLLDPYMGVTEKKIAAMFTQARNEHAILMLDEADSFLRDRGSAMRSWEVTQVNELLTQMERFEGLFLCSTNLMDALDPASLRRFDFKVKLDYLEGKQAWVLFKEVLKDQGLPVPESQFISAQISRLDNLTPGDFATVVRQSRLIAEGLTADGLYQGLLKESRFKADARPRQIGFTAQI
jgi:SpoVK/Ycf46/Vps4 family AAA+-type ATPase